MFGHHNIGVDPEVVPAPCDLQHLFKDIARPRCAKIGLPPVATEGDVVQVAGLLIALETLGHGGDFRMVCAAREGPKSGRMNAGRKTVAAAAAMSHSSQKRDEWGTQSSGALNGAAAGDVWATRPAMMTNTTVTPFCK